MGPGVSVAFYGVAGNCPVGGAHTLLSGYDAALTLCFSISARVTIPHPANQENRLTISPCVRLIEPTNDTRNPEIVPENKDLLG
jgi:hypothetical protein